MNDNKDSIWKQSRLSSIGYACMTGQHVECIRETCECLCHKGAQAD